MINSGFDGQRAILTCSNKVSLRGSDTESDFLSTEPNHSLA